VSVIFWDTVYTSTSLSKLPSSHVGAWNLQSIHLGLLIDNPLNENWRQLMTIPLCGISRSFCRVFYFYATLSIVRHMPSCGVRLSV